MTRASGAVFHQELARQLCDFLLPILRGERIGQQNVLSDKHMLTLQDVYCIYNRARGTDLISPMDLMKACKLFQPLGLPLRIRVFESGVIVVQTGELTF